MASANVEQYSSKCSLIVLRFYWAAAEEKNLEDALLRLLVGARSSSAGRGCVGAGGGNRYTTREIRGSAKNLVGVGGEGGQLTTRGRPVTTTTSHEPRASDAALRKKVILEYLVHYFAYAHEAR